MDRRNGHFPHSAAGPQGSSPSRGYWGIFSFSLLALMLVGGYELYHHERVDHAAQTLDIEKSTDSGKPTDSSRSTDSGKPTDSEKPGGSQESEESQERMKDRESHQPTKLCDDYVIYKQLSTLLRADQDFEAWNLSDTTNHDDNVNYMNIRQDIANDENFQKIMPGANVYAFYCSQTEHMFCLVNFGRGPGRDLVNVMSFVVDLLLLFALRITIGDDPPRKHTELRASLTKPFVNDTWYLLMAKPMRKHNTATEIAVAATLFPVTPHSPTVETIQNGTAEALGDLFLRFETKDPDRLPLAIQNNVQDESCRRIF
ncbi:MAG: hypothetical protein M1828_004530 [Chrysothrix sp. TS-e1954]|nr:MAG: hypothetical protein M1828_004530 [Chrysothrix sp. TS-e1954]